MYMKKYVFFLALIAIFMLQSCSIKDNSREKIYIGNCLVDNVYKHVKMDYFHGFMDRQTVDDLIKYHGKPDLSLMHTNQQPLKIMTFMSTVLTMVLSIVMFLIMVKVLNMSTTYILNSIKIWICPMLLQMVS